MKNTDYLPGMLRVLLLSELSRGEGYGYGLARSLELAGEGALSVRPESLYPVLHRLEQDGLIGARWDRAENGRPRRVYRLTPKGRKHWDRLRPAFVAQAQAALKAVNAEPAMAQGVRP